MAETCKLRWQRKRKCDVSLECLIIISVDNEPSTIPFLGRGTSSMIAMLRQSKFSVRQFARFVLGLLRWRIGCDVVWRYSELQWRQFCTFLLTVLFMLVHKTKLSIVVRFGIDQEEKMYHGVGWHLVLVIEGTNEFGVQLFCHRWTSRLHYDQFPWISQWFKQNV